MSPSCPGRISAKAPKVHDARDASFENFSGGYFMSEVFHPLKSFLSGFWIVGSDENETVVFNIDFNAGFVNDLIDDFSARSDDSRGFFPD